MPQTTATRPVAARQPAADLAKRVPIPRKAKTEAAEKMVSKTSSSAKDASKESKNDTIGGQNIKAAGGSKSQSKSKPKKSLNAVDSNKILKPKTNKSTTKNQRKPAKSKGKAAQPKNASKSTLVTEVGKRNQRRVAGTTSEDRTQAEVSTALKSRPIAVKSTKETNKLAYGTNSGHEEAPLYNDDDSAASLSDSDATFIPPKLPKRIVSYYVPLKVVHKESALRSTAGSNENETEAPGLLLLADAATSQS